MPSRRILPMIRSAFEGRYNVERLIAVGGAGCVFQARDAEGRAVALKVLHPELYISITADRFEEEIRIMSQLHHPRIASVLDFGEEEWLAYYVMEYIAGPNLTQQLRRLNHLTVNDTLHIADQVLDALAYAHGHNVIHRDIKPSNIMVSKNGIVLLDFGIARTLRDASRRGLTSEGVTVGTSYYMSPEQVGGDRDIDERTDLYSLGCVLFECLTGRPPFADADEAKVRSAHLECPPPNLLTIRADVPGGLAKLIAKGLVKDRCQRWRSASEMREALHSL